MLCLKRVINLEKVLKKLSREIIASWVLSPCYRLNMGRFLEFGNLHDVFGRACVLPLCFSFTQ